jgi:hypothetical protein
MSSSPLITLDRNHPAEVSTGGELETMLNKVEQQLSALGDALRLRDSSAIEGHAQALHLALEQAVNGFTRVAKTGHVPPPLRHRLVKASGQVAAQRETLVRATMALDRAIDLLMPADAAKPVYGSRGHRPLGMYSS